MLVDIGLRTSVQGTAEQAPDKLPSHVFALRHSESFAAEGIIIALRFSQREGKMGWPQSLGVCFLLHFITAPV